MSEDLMRYDLLAQQALRGVVRAALERASRDGLPGEHHFYVAFSTTAPGVQISQRLRERYAEEMTIVLQHQFYGLEVNHERFTVQLHFNNIPETLVVPLSAIKGFYDPSVQFGLQFDVGADTAEARRGRGRSLRPRRAANSQTPRETPDEAGNAAAGAAIEQARNEAEASGGIAAGGAQVVSIDQFRKK